MSENGAWSEYDELMGDLERDTRVGDHDFMVQDVETGKWSDLKAGLSDDPYFKITGVLLTAEQSKATLQWSPPPPAVVAKQQMASWDHKKRRAVANAVSIAKQLQEHYGKTFDQMKAGDVFRVKTGKTRRDADGKGGFIRVIAILPKEQIGQASIQAAQDASSVPF